MDRRPAVGLLLAFGAYASWGLLSPVGKHLLDDFEPMGLNAVRFVLATVAILPWLGRAGLRDSWKLLHRRDILWINLLANVSLTFFLYSLVRLEPTYSTLGFYSAPLWTAVFAHFALRERAGVWFAPAFVLLVAGGYLALFGWAAPSDGFDFLGIALALASAIVWAWYTVQLRRHAPAIGLKPLMGAGFLFGTAYYVALTMLVEGPPQLVGLAWTTWGWLAIHVLFPTLGAFILFSAALQRAPAGQVNILVAMELAFTVLFSWLLFGDRFTTIQLFGLGIALLAVSGYLWLQDREARAHAMTVAALPLPLTVGDAVAVNAHVEQSQQNSGQRTDAQDDEHIGNGP